MQSTCWYSTPLIPDSELRVSKRIISWESLQSADSAESTRSYYFNDAEERGATTYLWHNPLASTKTGLTSIGPQVDSVLRLRRPLRRDRRLSSAGRSVDCGLSSADQIARPLAHLRRPTRRFTRRVDLESERSWSGCCGFLEDDGEGYRRNTGLCIPIGASELFWVCRG